MTRHIKLIIIGANNPTIIELVKRQSNASDDTIEIVGFLDNNPKLKNRTLYNHKVLGQFTEIETIDITEYKFINTIASSTNVRYETTQFFESRNANFLTLIDPSVTTFGLTIGTGSIVYKGAILQPYVQLGDHCIVSSCSGIAHETTLGNYVFVGPASYICGKVNIADKVFIGTGAKILPNLSIGRDSIICAGSLVMENTDKGQKIMGIPGQPA